MACSDSNGAEPPRTTGRAVGRDAWLVYSFGGCSVDEAVMAVIDPELERHRQTWLGFTRLIKYSLSLIIIILVGMAIFLT
jgi:Bacterial aa3 type cytochrome c oxidase subunit IV